MAEQKPVLATGPAGARQLAADLRKPMPKDFIWDFTTVHQSHDDCPFRFQQDYGRECGSAGCAIGFAEVFYDNAVDFDPVNHFGMPETVEWQIFFNSCDEGGSFYKVLMNKVTPEMVADALDYWAHEQENRRVA
jgi:hypothetical protein